MSMADTDGVENAFSPEEQAAFDAMQNGQDFTPPPETPEAPTEPTEPPVGDPPPGDKTPVGDPPPTDEALADEEIRDSKGQPVVVDGKPQKRVSFHKFKRTEERAAAAERDRDELKTRYTRLEERLNILNEALQTPGPGAQQQNQPQDDDPAPDPSKDIFAYVEWQGRQIEKLKGTVEQTQTTQQMRDADIQLATDYRNQANEFAKTEPHFAHAYQYLINQRLVELELAGVSDPVARAQQVVREEKGLVAAALKEGKNPAERLFKMAEGRGFKRPAAAPAPIAKDPKALDAAPDGGAQQQAPAAQQQAAPKPSVTQVISQIKEGQLAAQSLSNGGGDALPNLTPQVLADMSQEEFDELVARLPQSKVRELLGG